MGSLPKWMHHHLSHFHAIAHAISTVGYLAPKHNDVFVWASDRRSLPHSPVSVLFSCER